MGEYIVLEDIIDKLENGGSNTYENLKDVILFLLRDLLDLRRKHEILQSEYSRRYESICESMDDW